MFGFKLRMDLSRECSLQFVKGLFNVNGVNGMLEEANMSSFTSHIFDRYCEEEDTAPVSTSFTSCADLTRRALQQT